MARGERKEKSEMMATGTSLVNYDAARSSLQKAHRVDEVKAIRDKAEAIRVYARQANDTEMQNWAVEIKLGAERRAGELIRQQQDSGALASKEKGRPQKCRDVTTLKSVGISRDQSAKWQKLAAVPESKFEQIVAEAKEKTGELTSAAVLREVVLTMTNANRQLAKIEAETKLAAAVVRPTIETFDLRVCMMQELLGELRGIDAIITDPPYEAAAVPLYGELARLARQALKPKGVLCVMTGVCHLPDILTRMCQHMPYRWAIAYMMPGQATQVFPRKVNCNWKPVLVFGGDKWIPRDVVDAEKDKRFHAWGQGEGGTGRIIDMLTEPDDLIADPFLGRHDLPGQREVTSSGVRNEVGDRARSECSCRNIARCTLRRIKRRQ
jgi:hypothetical protein